MKQHETFRDQICQLCKVWLYNYNTSCQDLIYCIYIYTWTSIPLFEYSFLSPSEKLLTQHFEKHINTQIIIIYS